MLPLFLLLVPSVQARAPGAHPSDPEALGSGLPPIVGRPRLDLDAGYLRPFVGFGVAATRLGDLDGDGHEDFAVGMKDSARDSVALFLGPDLVRPARLFDHTELDPVPQGGITSTDVGFGRALAALDVDGDGRRELVVGAPETRSAGGQLHGALFVLFLEPDGHVGASQRISPGIAGFPGVPGGSRLGSSLAVVPDLDGDGRDELVVGAPGYQAQTGAVWILFLQADGSVRQFQQIGNGVGGLGAVLHGREHFGSAAASPGDLNGDGIADLLVGAPVDLTLRRDTVWALFLDAAGLVQSAATIHSPVDPGTNLWLFGTSLAVLGDRNGDGLVEIVVGAPGTGGGTGRLWFLALDAAANVVASQEIGPGAGGLVGPVRPGDSFGDGLALAPDRNGDGQPELFVGATAAEEGCVDSGVGWYLTLSADGTVSAETRFAGDCRPGPSGGSFGSAFADLGDLNGDGRRELAVGAPFDGSGRVSVLSLERSGAVASSTFFTVGGANQRLGSALAAFGPPGGGGQNLVVGSPGAGGSFDPGSGAISFFTIRSNGSATLLRTLSASAFGGGVRNDRLGFALAVGRVDASGFPEIAVGAPGVDHPSAANSGAVDLVFIDGSLGIQRRVRYDAGSIALAAGDRFGSAVAFLGDLSGDGTTELAVGIPNFDDSFENRGAVSILSLDPDGTLRGSVRIASGRAGFVGPLGTGDRFGAALAALPDLDGDRVPELLVGAPGDDGAARNAGAAWVLFLAPDGRVRAATRVGPGGFAGAVQEGASFGRGLGLAGDVNGDGRVDLVFGAPGADLAPFEDLGLAWVARLGGTGRIDFQTEDDLVTPLVNGQALGTPPEFGRLFRLSALGANLGPTLFDSTPLGPNDPSQDRDLLVGKGHLLILQNSTSSTQTLPDVWDRPNDDADGGVLRFEFLQPQELLALDLVDIDLASGRTALVRLIDTSARTRTYFVPSGWTEDLVTEGPPGWRTLRLDTLAPQPGRHAAASASEDAGFAPAAVIRLEVELGGSGAVDDLVFRPAGG